jgi:hypothetical protein
MGHRKRTRKAAAFCWRFCRIHRKAFLGKSERDCSRCKDREPVDIGRLIDAGEKFVRLRQKIQEDVINAVALPPGAIGSKKPIPPFTPKRFKKGRRRP